MGVPEKHRKTFELYKYYQHMGARKVHVIAIANKSDMWYIDPNGMLIAENREGGLEPLSQDISSSTGWYEINAEIFRDDLSFDEYKFGKLDGRKIERFILRAYKNNNVFLFDLLNHTQDDGLYPNILVNDYNYVFKNISKIVNQQELIILDKILLERL